MLELCWCPNRVDTVAKDLRDYFKQFVDEDDVSHCFANKINEMPLELQWFKTHDVTFLTLSALQRKMLLMIYLNVRKRNKNLNKY